MAHAPVSDEKRAEVRRVFAETGNKAATARQCNLARSTVWEIVRDAVQPPGPVAAGNPVVVGAAPYSAAGTFIDPPPFPQPAPAAGGPTLPDPVDLQFQPVHIDTAGTWLVLGDCHFPFHDKCTIELAVEEARRRNAVGVLLNGDILDCAEVSVHEKDVDALDLVDEVEIGKQFLAWLRGRLPRARLIYRSGNHEDRIPRYFAANAPALQKLAGTLADWLKLSDIGGEWVTDKRIIQLGKLNVIHGHEFRGGAGSGVNPARGLYLKARSVAMCGHHHRTSEHHARNIRDHYEAAWSVGCACYIHPRWLPLNDWNHGFALVAVASDGTFAVENKRVFGGKIV
jgi:hypothetical protein